MLGAGLINRKTLTRAALIAALSCVLPLAAAHATPMDYTFTGTGGGTINGTAFTGTFTFVFDGNTANIVPFGTEWELPNVGGTFTEGGTTYSLDPISIGIIVNPDSSFPRAGFFNNDVTNGLTMNNSAFAGYDLATPLGPITAPTSGDPSSFLLPTLGGTTGFLLDGGADRLILTADSSLTFLAAPPPSSVPEPSTIALLAAGLLGIVLICPSSRQPAIFGRNSIT
jgi:hypothetical protein